MKEYNSYPHRHYPSGSKPGSEQKQRKSQRHQREQDIVDTFPEAPTKAIVYGGPDKDVDDWLEDIETVISDNDKFVRALGHHTGIEVD